MLRSIVIQNLALIDEIELTFRCGLTVVTGETGAGKSILIQAISALLGETVHSETVQSGHKSAVVEAVFDGTENLTETIRFKALQLEQGPLGSIAIRREIFRSGRSRYLLNDQIVKKSEFQWVGRTLLDVNSQHSHQKLLNKRYHLELLDSTLPSQTLLTNVQSAYDNWQKCTEKYLKMNAHVKDLNRRHQLISYQIQEIENAKLIPGEKDTLIEERQRLRYAEEILDNLQSAVDSLDGGSSGVADRVAGIAHMIERASSRDSRLQPVSEQADSLLLLARDLADEVRHALDLIEHSPDRLDQVSQRLHELQQLEGKFKSDVDGIIEYQNSIRKELEGFTFRKAELVELADLWNTYRSRYISADADLQTYRRKQSLSTCRQIEKGLSGLGMKHVRFQASFDEPWKNPEMTTGEIPDRCTNQGTDQLEFLLSANPGVPLKPLTDIASGGELSRIMLTLKQYLGQRSDSQVVIFDEVDSGIGGDVARSVADQLVVLASEKQVICVTHLPQIAVKGANHNLVKKSVEKDQTLVSIREVSGKARVQEIARMLSGDNNDKTAYAHAESMLKSS